MEHPPSVDRVLTHPLLRPYNQRFSHPAMAELVRQEIEVVRQGIASGSGNLSLEEIALAVARHLKALEEVGPHPVINATGVILHTNLGRAPLSLEAMTAMTAAAGGYSDLELDRNTGRRGSRQQHVASLLCLATGGEAALVVNNNASAVLLALTALARRKEVILSRGQAVEIGGGFRIPHIMAQSGAKLVEVGTTNRTYIADYEKATTPRTAALMRVHTSNFKLVGFTQSATIEEMVALGARYHLPVLDDLGSGCLLDTTQFGLDAEPTLQGSLAAGADLVFASGDKLLGGPQAGIVVGKETWVDRLREHPLARAVRIDGPRLAALAATLLHYLKGEAPDKIPIWRMISASPEVLEDRAQSWAQNLPGDARVVAGTSMVGGGSLPGSSLPTPLVAIPLRGLSALKVTQRLRQHRPPVLGRIEKEYLLLDPRTVLPEQETALMEALHHAFDFGSKGP